jgi:RimJ/RimL family protein N-acetyltransferase
VKHELQTERLQLRHWRDEDIEPFFAMLGDPRVTRYLGDGSVVVDKEALRARMNKRREDWDRIGYASWAVVERERNRLIGACGFLAMEGFPEVEYAYQFGVDAWGKGYATEAGRAALDYVRDHKLLDRVIAITYPQNRASQRVLEKLGFDYAGIGGYFRVPVETFVLLMKDEPAPEWELEAVLPVAPVDAYVAFTEPSELARWAGEGYAVEAVVAGTWRNGAGAEGRVQIALPGERVRVAFDAGGYLDARFDGMAGGTRVRISGRALPSGAGGKASWQATLAELERLQDD